MADWDTTEGLDRFCSATTAAFTIEQRKAGEGVWRCCCINGGMLVVALAVGASYVAAAARCSGEL